MELSPQLAHRRGAMAPWFPALAFVVVAGSVATWVAASVAWLPMQHFGHQWFAFRSRPWLDGWARWDAGWYWGIARHGYFLTPGHQSSVAFFPSYPLLMRALAPVLGGPLLAGIAISAASGLAAAVLFGRWCRRFLPEGAAKVAVLCLLLSPFSFFLMGAVYADALFLALALGAFLLLELDHAVLAGAVAAVATASRPVGLALVVGLVVRAVERRGALDRHLRLPDRLRRLRPGDAGVALSVLGLLAFALLLWHRFGNPLAFAAEEGEWGQPAGWHTWLKVPFIDAFRHPALDLLHVRLALHAALAVGALALVPLVVRRIGWGYGAYTAMAVGIPVISTADFMGMGRYLLAAFPLFAVLGLVLRRRPALGVTTLAASASGLAVMASLFARWNYVS